MYKRQGTFSDGKLNTGTKDTRARKVLEEFAAAGAPEEILFQAKPHKMCIRDSLL